MMLRGKLVALATVLASAAPASADDVGFVIEQEECPAAFKGVGLALRDVDGGVAFDFTTPRKHAVADLRRLLREAAILLEEHTETEAARTDVQRMPDDFVLPALDITVKDVAAGARVTVRAEARRSLVDVRANARLFRRVWLSHPCIRGSAPSLAQRR